MAPRKRSSGLATETVSEVASASKRQKQIKKDDSTESVESKAKSKKRLASEGKSGLPSPVKKFFETKPKQRKNVKRSLEGSNKTQPGQVEVEDVPVNEMNVEQLLALGERTEGVGFSASKVDDIEDSSESDMSDLEEVKNADFKEPVIPKEGVNITLEVPNAFYKQKKKHLDLEAHLKRQLNRVKKDLQLLMHKVHVLCWIAHLRFVNNTLNNPILMERSSSLIKSKNLYPSKYADLSYLEGILKWYHKIIELKKEVDPSCTGGLLEELQYQIEKKEAFTCKSFIFMFIILLRVLGLKVRIVMSFQVLPVRPSVLELYGDIIKARSEKLRKLKEEAGTSKESNKSEVKKPVDTPSQKITKRKSSCTKDSGQVKKDEKNSEVVNSDDEFESKHFRPSIKSTKKNPKSKLKADEQDLSKNKCTKSNVDVKKQVNIEIDEDEDDFTPLSLKKKNTQRKSSRKSDVSEESQKKEGSDVWVEVYLEAEEKWISVDVPRQKIHCISEIYARTTHPVAYIIACNNDQTLKDVTKRYVPNWHSDTRKRRVDEDWWNETIRPYLPEKTAQDKEEDEDINRQLLDKPLPSSISEFKDHPLYVLKRHLLKFEALYPPDAPTLGFVRGEPVYARECVHLLHSREMWYKQARVVRLKEEPYKIVKARPKYDKMSGEIKKDLPLELFGKWQTEDYIPPIATDGKVPRNEYGNVDLFLPCMLPIGTVHLQIPALNKIAKKLNIDCAPATVGFDFHSGGSHPVFDGFVVCEEFKEVLLDAWNKEIDEVSKKEAEKKEKRVYGNWRRLIRGLLIREKLKIKYAFGENSDDEDDSKCAAERPRSSAEAKE